LIYIMPFTIRPLEDSDLQTAGTILNLAFHTSGSRLDDLRLYRRMQPDGWFVAAQAERLVGMVGAANYGTVAHVGLMAVHPDIQRQGVGLALMQFLLARLDGQGVPLVTLDASAAGQPLYQKLGFIAWDETLVLQRGKPAARPYLPANVQLMSIRELDEVVQADMGVFGAGRRNVLQTLLETFPGRAFLQRDEQGVLTGYLFAQHNRLGPWVMFQPGDPQSLLRVALSLPYAGAFSVTVPSGNLVALELLHRHGFERVRANRHMGRGAGGPPGQRWKIYSQTGLAVG
jgi:predicted N-acetyltransferase YhbS